MIQRYLYCFSKTVDRLTEGVSELREASAADEYRKCRLETEDGGRRVGPGERAEDSWEEEEAREGMLVFSVRC